MQQDQICAKPQFKVVISDDEQYSLWPAFHDNAAGWKDAGIQGTQVECLAFIESRWTDMRPKTLRLNMEQAGTSASSKHDDLALLPE